MKQAIYGLVLYIFLMLPPVISLSEAIMSIHMHMQMPLIGVAGMLMAPYLKKLFPTFFEKFNKNGIPGILLVLIVILYWLLPRAMDEALALWSVEVFKFFSWAFLIGVPLRDSWGKLSDLMKNIFFVFLSIVYLFMAWLYIFADNQLCNNYVIVEQITLGWGFLFIAISLLLFFVQTLFIDHSEYEE